MQNKTRLAGFLVAEGVLDVFFDIGGRGCDLFADVVGIRFGLGLVVVGGIVDAFLDGSPGLLSMALDLLRRAFVGELVAADGFADTLLHVADRFVEFSFDGAIACAHGHSFGTLVSIRGEDGARYGPIRAVRWPNTAGPPD